ncbi:MAG: CopG family ribbon-helix-helix protein [Candidatus Aenigmarchaeota archaeon]|nr:CopG family ribbon-helix-helix protein [Candidatus Aenigmarchaeota archaeon]
MAQRILSLSVSPELAREMQRIQKEMGFSGRSEMLRAGLRKIMVEHKQQEALVGQKQGILLLMHSKGAEDAVTFAKHEFEEIITTQIHNNLPGGKCLEVFVLSGDAATIKKMHSQLETSKKIDYVKLVVT